MNIEHQNIIINQNNIDEYQNIGYFTAAEYEQKWDAAGELVPDGDKVILYKYSIDNGLNLPPSHDLHKFVRMHNENIPYYFKHEAQHSHNANIGFSFNLVDRICYTYIAAYFLDEISARMASNLYHIQKQNIQSSGLNVTEHALLNALTEFSNRQIFIEYCNLAALSYSYCILAMIKTNQANLVRDIISNQIPLHADYSKHQQLYTDSFYNTVNQYFIIDNIDVKTSIGKNAKSVFAEMRQQITPTMFAMSQQCLMFLKQNCL